MIQKQIPAAVRADFGKGAARRLRADGKTPAILYKNGEDALALQVDTGLLHKNLMEIHGRNAVITLDIAGDSEDQRHVMVQEIQQDPVTDMVLHVDFLEIALDKPVTLSVPIEYQGTARGVDIGGELQIFLSSVRLKGLPLAIPDQVEVNIEPLDRGDKGITCGELSVPEGVEMIDDSQAVCVSVT